MHETRCEHHVRIFRKVHPVCVFVCVCVVNEVCVCLNMQSRTQVGDSISLASEVCEQYDTFA